MPHLLGTEVDHEGTPKSAQAQTGQRLRLEDPVVLRGRLALDDDTLVHHEIESAWL